MSVGERHLQVQRHTGRLDMFLIGGFALASLLGVSLINLWPDGSGEALVVIFPPWTDAAAAATAASNAGAALVTFGSFPFVVFVRPFDARYPGRVMHDGALFVLSAKGLRGCSSPSRNAT